MQLSTHRSANGKHMQVLQASAGASVEALCDWIQQHRGTLEKSWTTHGTLRLRGFAADSAQAFEQVARTLDPDLKNDYLGTSPRSARSTYVFSASELPPHFPIPQHIEMSFLPSAPRRLFFNCAVATATQGETPTVDYRAVYRDLPAEVRDEFEHKGVRNIRNYNGPNSPTGKDLWKLKRWDEMFLTTDRAVVERIATEQGLRCEWREQDRLRLVNEQAAVRVHPETGEKVWFNHSQVFHLEAAALEYRKILGYQKTARSLGYAALTSALTLLKRRVPVEDQAMHCTFADGSPIPLRHMRAVSDAIWKNLVIEPWRVGDILAIDNRSTGHGRLPFSGPRDVLVAWTGA